MENDQRFQELLQNLPDNEADFSSIIYKSRMMERAISRARKVAVWALPVLIEGESGTGKELFARAIHNGACLCKPST